MDIKTNNPNPAKTYHLLLDFKHMHLNPFNLHFSGSIKHLERIYQQEYLKNSLVHIRIALVLGCLIYAIFGVLDAILLPDEKYFIWAIRYLILCPSILLVFFLSRFKIMQQWIQQILAGLILIAGGGIIIMILIAPPSRKLFLLCRLDFDFYLWLQLHLRTFYLGFIGRMDGCPAL